LIRGSSRLDDLMDEITEQITLFPVNLQQVRVKLPLIEKAKSREFRDSITVADLEEIRRELRGIMRYRARPANPAFPPRVIDLKESESLVERKRHRVKLAGLDMIAYRNRVHHVLQEIIDANPTLQKIQAGQPVDEWELEALCSLVLTFDSGLDLHDLEEYFPETAGHLDQAIRGIIGMDAGTVQARFTRFVQQHPNLAANQIKFLDLLQNHIAKNGSIQVERLYEPPFTLIHTDSLDGVFETSLADELMEIIDSFQNKETRDGPAT
jgi:type I restriction enzyme R subunit